MREFIKARRENFSLEKIRKDILLLLSEHEDKLRHFLSSSTRIKRVDYEDLKKILQENLDYSGEEREQVKRILHSMAKNLQNILSLDQVDESDELQVYKTRIEPVLYNNFLVLESIVRKNDSTETRGKSKGTKGWSVGGYKSEFGE